MVSCKQQTAKDILKDTIGISNFNRSSKILFTSSNRTKDSDIHLNFEIQPAHHKGPHRRASQGLIPAAPQQQLVTHKNKCINTSLPSIEQTANSIFSSNPKPMKRQRFKCQMLFPPLKEILNNQGPISQKFTSQTQSVGSRYEQPPQEEVKTPNHESIQEQPSALTMKEIYEEITVDGMTEINKSDKKNPRKTVKQSTQYNGTEAKQSQIRSFQNSRNKSESHFSLEIQFEKNSKVNTNRNSTRGTRDSPYQNLRLNETPRNYEESNEEQLVPITISNFNLAKLKRKTKKQVNKMN